MRFECVSRTHVGLRRKINEDSVMVRTEDALWAVADGMGGHEAGEVASALVADALHRVPAGADLDELVDQSIAALCEANRELLALARSDGSQRSIGTTVVGVAVRDGRFRCFWAGDSRAYWFRDGGIMRLSRDHSLVQDLIDAGMLKPEEAEQHESSSVITRAVGVAETLNVDTVSGEASPGDQFLLATDGLTRVVSDDELAAELARAPTAEEAGDNLIEMVLARGAPDNVSLIIVTLA
jgi:serine/threonine protein phosphatase Stp1